MPQIPGAAKLTARQLQILEHARSDGQVEVESLARRFAVTPQTIRRDLAGLCDQQLMRRTHGGAVVDRGVANLGYAARRRLGVRSKIRIGRCAARLIPNDASLFVNIGTTTEQVARHLAEHTGLVVITNNVNVIEILRPCRDIELITAGGSVRREDGGIVGDQTADFIAQFKVDYAVIGASAIEEDGTLLDFDPREVRVAKAIIANSRSVILVADSSKFSRSAPVRIGNVVEVDHFVTDASPPVRFREHCELHGVHVVVADPEATDPTATTRVAAS